MEALDAIVVRRVVAIDDLGAGRGAAVIGRVRRLVREVRASRPDLTGYHLHDVGLAARAGRLMVNLYFCR
ncbi:MAG: hypothetical protein ACM3XN_02130 [Chloroflexota bacterium]